MAQIPCPDYITTPVALVPARIICTNRTCIANRFVGFCMSIDLSAEQRDEIGEGFVAWSCWDLPISHIAQIDDDRGEDLVCVSIQDRVYWLDWERYQDEWYWNSFAPIHRMVRIGPVPSNLNETERGGYEIRMVKRFREFQWSLENGATGAPGANWTIRVAEWQREEQTERSTERRTNKRMRAQVATKGQSFIITLEHKANEPCTITDWTALWDVVGARVRESGQG